VATRGDVLDNPATGQRLVFRKTARETGGKFLEVESVYTRPSSNRPPAHYYPHQEECFEVLSGALRARVGGEDRDLREGDVLVVPPGTTHEMWTEEAGTRMSWRTYPALNTEAFFDVIWGLARDGKTDGKGAPDLLQMAVIAREYANEFRLAKPPWPVQRIVFAVLAPVGRLLGYRARYPERC
jgi:quercetin dioxygenase-like cupin family protein